jgi:hypothetical protein
MLLVDCPEWARSASKDLCNWVEKWKPLKMKLHILLSLFLLILAVHGEDKLFRMVFRALPAASTHPLP